MSTTTRLRNKIAESNHTDRQYTASRQGKITQAGFDQLTEEWQPPDKPALALEDEMMVKREPEEEEQDTQTAQTYNNTQGNLKKLYMKPWCTIPSSNRG